MKYVADVHVSHASKCCKLVNFFCTAVIRSKSLFDTKNVLAKLKTFTLFFCLFSSTDTYQSKKDLHSL